VKLDWDISVGSLASLGGAQQPPAGGQFVTAPNPFTGVTENVTAPNLFTGNSERVSAPKVV
jgi:hypothetical protein